jgi:hypothetical protein
MYKQIAAALLSCITFSSFAYTIGQQLTITNNTDTAMQIDIDAVNNQAAVSRAIPAHATIELYTENGDNSGWLYQLAIAPFKITDTTNKTEYVKGNLEFYVGGTYRRKHSFLNSVTAGKGLQLTTNYTCAVADDGYVRQNKIILNGTPTPVIKFENNPKQCVGIHSSTLVRKEENIYDYTIHCSDRSPYFPGWVYHTHKDDTGKVDEMYFWWQAARPGITTKVTGKFANDLYHDNPIALKKFKKLLDQKIGDDQYCKSLSL